MALCPKSSASAGTFSCLQCSGDTFCPCTVIQVSRSKFHKSSADSDRAGREDMTAFKRTAEFFSVSYQWRFSPLRWVRIVG
jgi:hypothetical protein